MSAVLLVLLLVVASVGYAAEFIYDNAPFPSCHASSLVETKPGEILAAWFGGSDEGEADVAIWSARRVDGKWSAPVEIAREHKIATYNPVLFHTRGGTLWLYYRFGPSPMTWTSARKSSRDQGATWSPVEYLPAGLHGPIKNKPLVLPDGTVLAGTSVESYQAWTAWVDRSSDEGRTWTRHGPVVVPKQAKGIIQPAIVRLPNGSLRMFLRATPAIGRICISDSTDGGRSWTDAKPTSLPNPNSGLDAVTLRDGRIVLVYNHTEKGRSPLNVAVSRNGDDWNMFRTLESEPGEYSYPAVIQANDGAIHITYTWKRRKIRYESIPLSAIPDGGERK